jgi:hypothetical protein
MLKIKVICVVAAAWLLACGGMIDADDPGSGQTPPAGDPGVSDPGPGPETCGDGLDNDGNGKVDDTCACSPADQPSQSCYPGPASTRNVGQCRDGVQHCESSGEFSAWGVCVGAIVPAEDICGDQIDNNCDGQVDETCACKPGESRPCYGGPPNTKDVGQCRAGTQQCLPSVGFEKTCVGEVLPAKEVCDDGKDNDCNGLVDEGCIAVHAPQICTTASLTHAVGAADCGPNKAVFMMDDGTGPNFICCPLPASDILSGNPPQVRAGQCGPGEVITGASSPFTFRCTAINTNRYKLGAAKQPCYFGSGASGSQGVAKCQGHPASFSVLQQNLFGSDGCTGFPFGSLFIRQSSKYCKDMLAVQLLYTGTVAGDPPAGTPVVMYQ